MNKLLLFFLCLIICVSCKPNKTKQVYPQEKQWAHRANDTLEARRKQQYFPGLEVDVRYLDNRLLVAHDWVDTAQKLDFFEWIDALNNINSTYLWLDIKNLSSDNVHQVIQLLNQSFTTAQKSKVFVESYNFSPLRHIKRAGYQVILWLPDITETDNADLDSWVKQSRKHINKLRPNAISADYSMLQTLDTFFPDEKIHLWQKSNDNSIEDRRITKNICSFENVVVLLVDYEKP